MSDDRTHRRRGGRPSVLGVIPARGGSKEIPNKNIRPLGGRPLLQYTIDAGRASGAIDRLVVSTDSPEIAEIATRLGAEVPFLRPAELAQDDTPMLPVVQHAVRKMEELGFRSEIVVLLQPTSPLRRPRHIGEAVDLLRESRCDSVVTVVEIPKHLSPYYALRIEKGRLEHLIPGGPLIPNRQKVPPLYMRDGSVYVVRRDVLVEKDTLYGDDCRPLTVSPEDSLNLNDMSDWTLAEVRLASS